MSCKLSEKCDNVFACNVLRPEVELLGCNFYKPKKPMTNEEWIRQANTEQLADALLNIMANNEFTLYLLHTEKKSVQEIKDAVVEWLKQPHSEVGK